MLTLACGCAGGMTHVCAGMLLQRMKVCAHMTGWLATKVMTAVTGVPDAVLAGTCTRVLDDP